MAKGAPPRTVRFAYVVVAIAAVNFFSFGVAAILLGGDAVNGKREGNRYFLV